MRCCFFFPGRASPWDGFTEEKKRHWSTLSLAPLGRWLGAGVVLAGLIYGAEVARTTLEQQGLMRMFWLMRITCP